MAIEAKIMNIPIDRWLLKELSEVDSQITKGDIDIELNDVAKMKLTNDENMAHNDSQ